MLLFFLVYGSDTQKDSQNKDEKIEENQNTASIINDGIDFDSETNNNNNTNKEPKTNENGKQKDHRTNKVKKIVFV